MNMRRKKFKTGKSIKKPVLSYDYIVENETCVTPCPYDNTIRIGSIICKNYMSGNYNSMKGTGRVSCKKLYA